MNKIINLEEIIKKHSNVCIDDREDILVAMKEACREALELAAERYIHDVTFESDSEEYLKQTIINTINQIQ